MDGAVTLTMERDKIPELIFPSPTPWKDVVRVQPASRYLAPLADPVVAGEHLLAEDGIQPSQLRLEGMADLGAGRGLLDHRHGLHAMILERMRSQRGTAPQAS